jgi:hypothetical protein
LGAKVFPGRFTADTDEPFVVFIVGMRFNKILSPKWFAGVKAFDKMYRALMSDPELGFLGAEKILYWRGSGQIQYWRSMEHLERFARGVDGTHVPAWKHYNQIVRTSGTVGVWHETYIMEPGKAEAIYANMPEFGLGKVLDHVPAIGHRETARRRLGGQNEPAVESPPQPVAEKV